MSHCGLRGYWRTGWSDPHPGTKTARLIALLRSGAMSTEDINAALGTRGRQVMGSCFQRLTDDCGYIIQSWRDPALTRDGRNYHRYRITGRLDFGGGVAEDYTL